MSTKQGKHIAIAKAKGSLKEIAWLPIALCLPSWKPFSKTIVESYKYTIIVVTRISKNVIYSAHIVSNKRKQ